MKQINMWILTREENEYDQYGEYFVAAWNTKPTLEQLLDLEQLCYEDLNHLLAGGGRIDNAQTWYYLHEYEEGSPF